MRSGHSVALQCSLVHIQCGLIQSPDLHQCWLIHWYQDAVHRVFMQCVHAHVSVEEYLNFTSTLHVSSSTCIFSRI